jgi:hypothetical protein
LQCEVSNKQFTKKKKCKRQGRDKYLAYKEMEPRIKLHNPKESIPK